MRQFIQRFFMLLPFVVIISLISSFIAFESNNAIAHAIPVVLGFLTITGLGVIYFGIEYEGDIWRRKKRQRLMEVWAFNVCLF